MKKNLIIKIQMMFLVIITIFSLSSTTIYASDDLMDIFDEADKFVEDGQKSTTKVIPESTMQDMSNMIYNILLVIAIIIAVIVGMIIGIQYMVGSVGERVRLKEGLIPYVVGCAVVFGAFAIWKMVVIILQSAPSA